MTVFETFQTTAYTYLEISRGGVYGNQILSERELQGVFKRRSGRTMGIMEVTNSEATLHVKPGDFDKTNFVGDGVRVDGVDYQIVGVTDGCNYHTNQIEHYRLTLERADYGKGDD